MLIVTVDPAIRPEALRKLVAAAEMGEVPLNVFILPLVLDVSGLRPWQFFLVPSAILTIWLFFWLDRLGKRTRMTNQQT